MQRNNGNDVQEKTAKINVKHKYLKKIQPMKKTRESPQKYSPRLAKHD
jgi:hypothetical protein